MNSLSIFERHFTLGVTAQGFRGGPWSGCARDRQAGRHRGARRGALRARRSLRFKYKQYFCTRGTPCPSVGRLRRTLMLVRARAYREQGRPPLETAWAVPGRCLALIFLLPLACFGCVRNYSMDAKVGTTGAKYYTVAARQGGVQTNDSQVADRLYEAAKQAAGTGLVADGRLATLAAWVGERLGPSGLLPDRAEVEFLTRHLGLIEPTPAVFLVPQGDLSEVAAELAQGINERKSQSIPTHFGAVLSRAYGRSFWVVVLSERRLQLQSLPRSVDLKAEVTLRGALPLGFKKPQVRVRTSRGALQDLPAGPGSRFDISLPTDRAVVLNIEISAEGEHGRRVLATMPVYVAQEPPVDARHAPKAIGMSLQDAERAVIDAIQTRRQEAGLPSLRVDSALSATAARHTAEMSSRFVVAHEGKDGSAPPDRVRAAGFESGLVFENVGRGRDALLLHDDFMSHPDQRAPVLNPEVTHLGLGLARTENVGGDVYYLTEIFVGVPQAFDPQRAPTQVLERLNQLRAEREASPLVLDEALSGIAQDAVAAYFTEPYPTQQVVLDQANLELADFSMSYQKTAAAMMVVRSPSGVALDSTLAEGATHVGIAVASTDAGRSDMQPADLAVLLTLGWARTD